MQEPQTAEAKYVYGIISGNERRRFGRDGIGGPGHQIYTISYQGISAVVSDTLLEPHEPTIEHVLAHESVIEEVMGGDTVLPLRFGIVFASQARVKEMLAENYLQYDENLVRLHGKVEMGLKILWSDADIKREVERANKQVALFRVEMAGRVEKLKQIRGTPGMRGQGYYLQMRLEKDVAQLDLLIREEMQTSREKETLRIFNDLRGLAVDACLNNLLEQSMILNAAFLVWREKCDVFRQRVEELKRANAEKGLTFTFNGPWPPYNFVDMSGDMSGVLCKWK